MTLQLLKYRLKTNLKIMQVDQIKIILIFQYLVSKQLKLVKYRNSLNSPIQKTMETICDITKTSLISFVNQYTKI